MSQWQPIETAPKDGTDIVLLFAREDEMFKSEPLLPRRRAARWYRGAWSVPHFSGNMPTHWAPFPALPGADAADRWAEPLYRHAYGCPMGWIGDKLIYGPGYRQEDMKAWLVELRRLLDFEHPEGSQLHTPKIVDTE